MRILFPLAGFPTLWRCGEYLTYKRFIKANADRAYFFMVLPEGAVPIDGTDLPSTTMLRSRSDSGYYFFRDLGSFCHVNDGQYIVDAAIAFTPQQAVQMDLMINAFGFNGPIKMHRIPIFIWQPMIWAWKDEQALEWMGQYPQVFGSDWEEQIFMNFARRNWTPSKVEEVAARNRIIGAGHEFNAFAEEYGKSTKNDVFTVIWGARFNKAHEPEMCMRAMLRLFETGANAQYTICSPDTGMPPEVEKIAKTINAKVLLRCPPQEYRQELAKSHVYLRCGVAANTAEHVEAVALNTIPIFQKKLYHSHLPKYWHTPADEKELIAHLLQTYKTYDKDFAKFTEWREQWKEFDTSVKHREVYDFLKELHNPSKRKGKMKSRRAERCVDHLQFLGDGATLTEICDRVVTSGGFVRDRGIGRWLTRKAVHDLLIVSDGVQDMLDGPEPRYRLTKQRQLSGLPESAWNLMEDDHEEELLLDKH